MDILTLLIYMMAIAETGALIAALIFVTRAMHEKKNQRIKKGKKGAQDNEISRKAVAASYRKACIFFGVYIVLNFIRNYSGMLD